jgi:5-methyltetrahydrofolate--homocysteine methyltransferase
MKSRLLDTLAARVLFYDGGMGTQLQARELTADDFGGKRLEGCIDHLSLSRPDVVEAVHGAYLEAGADAVETNSFQASRLRLEEWGIGDRTLDLNRSAAAIARRMVWTASRARTVARAS